MSDVTPTPLKDPNAASQRQVIMVAVLGVVLLLVLVFMVIKPFGGGSSPAPVPESSPATTAPADAGTTATPAAETATAPAIAPPPGRPGRSPFDPPR
jgi:hypothetical protein